MGAFGDAQEWGSAGCGNKIPNLWPEQELFINVRMLEKWFVGFLREGQIFIF